MGILDPLKGPSYALLKCSNHFGINTNSVNRYLPKIISYIPLMDSSTLKSHVKTSIALSVGKVKYTLTLILVVIFPACVRHCIKAYSLGRIF